MQDSKMMNFVFSPEFKKILEKMVKKDKLGLKKVENQVFPRFLKALQLFLCHNKDNVILQDTSFYFLSVAIFYPCAGGRLSFVQFYCARSGYNC